MSRYKYVGNKNPWDTTVILILGYEPDGTQVSVGVGGEADISHSQYLSLKENFIFEKVQEELTSSRPQVVKSDYKPVATATDKA